MLDYDAEATAYDTTRGGVPRADAAAEAVLSLVPGYARTLLDVGCGTGLVTERYARRSSLTVFAVDPAPGMARMAARRVGATVVLGDSRQLPYGTRTLDAVVTVWLLHLVPFSAAVIAEAARVLRPGGVFVTTVDKDAAHHAGSDIEALLAPYRASREPYDAAATVSETATRHGLTPAGEAHFTGHGQGRSPRRAAADVERGYYASLLGSHDPAEPARRLAALPEPDEPRPDPVYRLLAFRKR
ncbi:class I SAM-dependent methyltransferase [Actinacidiphila soli]|jgi:SAM-dependent methyltransferase|uniref:class I SAM-dependent methyltransferase n=1 Tax=Actinacidiphila soli TaxID=2487275 RepID=UPI000FCAA5B9|nr:class I SAM-dependent methyltransferase [Actinacidiphila soli]